MSDELKAGDAIAENRKEFVPDKAGEENSEKREPLQVKEPVIVPPVVSTPVVEGPSREPRFDGIRCSTCREVKTDEQLMKNPIEYKQNPDGSVTLTGARYSIFCGTCQKFLGIYDPVAQNELNDMLKKRNEIQ